jgi:hypothetical protein
MEHWMIKNYNGEWCFRDEVFFSSKAAIKRLTEFLLESNPVITEIAKDESYKVQTGPCEFSVIKVTSEPSQTSLFNLYIQAVSFAAEKHKFQRRKGDNSSYICHPIRVSELVLKFNNGKVDDAVIAAVLHDTVEDTNTTPDEIEEKFGKAVRDLVAEVTDDKSLSKLDRKKLQVINAPKKSRKAQYIKIADKIDNLRDLQQIPPKDWTTERIRGYYVWSSAVLSGCNPPTFFNEILDDIFSYKINGELLLSEDKEINETMLDKYYESMKELE